MIMKIASLPPQSRERQRLGFAMFFNDNEKPCYHAQPLAEPRVSTSGSRYRRAEHFNGAVKPK
jgi:hypothetical protein